MKVTTLVLDKDGDPYFQTEDQFNLEELFGIAKSREQAFRDMGVERAVGAVTFFAGEVTKAVNTGEHADVTKAVIQMLMAAWLFDSLYGGITAAHYLASDLNFTIAADGTVARTHVPATKVSAAH